MKLYFAIDKENEIHLMSKNRSREYLILYNPIDKFIGFYIYDPKIIDTIEIENTNYKEIFNKFKFEYPEYFI